MKSVVFFVLILLFALFNGAIGLVLSDKGLMGNFLSYFVYIAYCSISGMGVGWILVKIMF